jgi:prolipoprotein diacylglyceryltransferase
VELFFVRLGNFFNSEIIGKETNSTFGIKFIRDQFSPMPNATQISNPNEAYQAIANNPQFVNLLEQVPARHPAQLYEAFCYVFVLRSCFLILENRSQTKIWIFIRTFLVLFYVLLSNM